MAKYKPFVITLTEEQTNWINKSAKEFKLKGTEFMRMIIDHVKDTDIKSLKTNLTKSRLENMLKEAEEQATAFARKKEELEAQLEKLNA